MYMYSFTDEEDLHDVYGEVVNLKSSYYQLGVGLYLPASELDNIRKRFSQDIDQAVIDVLLVWLRQCYNIEKFGLPTWRRLVEAVDSPAGGNNHKLAKFIASHHPVSDHPASSPNPTGKFVVLCAS